MVESPVSPNSEVDIGARKARHLEVCVAPEEFDVETGTTGFEWVRFLHHALPELSLNDVDLRVRFFGHIVSMPLFISCMTGGSEGAYEVNRILAQGAQEAGIPVGMGSIRILFRKPEVIEHFRLKRFAPDVPVIANIGAMQLREPDATSRLCELVRELEVDGLVVHLNPGQEIVQPEGDRDFGGLLSAIGELVASSTLPIIVKETGFGMRPSEVVALIDAGATYVDIAGAGGTNWARVEGYRLSDEERQAAFDLDGWGIPTAVCLRALAMREDGRRVLREGRILASGGIRTGIDVAKAIALGAAHVGTALPLVRAVAEDGLPGVAAAIERFRTTLRRVLLLTGSAHPFDLTAGVAYSDSRLETWAKAVSDADDRLERERANADRRGRLRGTE